MTLLKWAGGKRALAPTITARLRAGLDAAQRDAAPGAVLQYVEPFFGSGAVFFAFAAELAERGVLCELSDASIDLVSFWCGAQAHTAQTVAVIEAEQARYTADWLADGGAAVSGGRAEARYRRWRNWINGILPPDVAQAWELPPVGHPAGFSALFWLINRCGFNGLWRVSRRGMCNVPWGKRAVRGEPAERAASFHAAADALNRAPTTVRYADFSKTLETADSGSIVYLDPPYDGDDFTAYAAVPFDTDELFTHVERAVARGARILMSNADTPRVRAGAATTGGVLEVVRERVTISRKGTQKNPRPAVLVGWGI